MNRILLDENLPYGLGELLPGEASHVTDLGWDGISNGRLLAAAEEAGFDVLVTADRNLRHQQNLGGRRLAIVVLNTNNWNRVRASYRLVILAVQAIEAGGYLEVDLTRRTAQQRTEEPKS